MEKTHPNDTPLTQTDKAKQALYPVHLFPILKAHVVEVDRLSPEITNVVGFKRVKGDDIIVHCEINSRPYDGLMKSENVRSALESFMQHWFVVASVKVLAWRLADKKKGKPHLSIDYVINAGTRKTEANA